MYVTYGKCFRVQQFCSAKHKHFSGSRAGGGEQHLACSCFSSFTLCFSARTTRHFAWLHVANFRTYARFVSHFTCPNAQYNVCRHIMRLTFFLSLFCWSIGIFQEMQLERVKGIARHGAAWLCNVHMKWLKVFK